jgi:phosphoserine phosphatase
MMRRNGYITILLSDGFDVVANHIKNRLGFDFCLSNRLVMRKGVSTGELEFPEYFSHPEKGYDRSGIFTYLTKKFNVPEKNIVFISNQPEDLPLLQSAGLGLTTSAAPEEIQSVADKILPAENLKPLLAYVTAAYKRKPLLTRSTKRYIAGALAIGAIAGYYFYKRNSRFNVERLTLNV